MNARFGPLGSTAVTLSDQRGMSPAVGRQTKRDIEIVVHDALVAEMVEQGRGLLAGTAMQMQGSLNALEDHLNQISPTGAHRLAAINDAFAIGAAQAVARYGR